MNISNEDQVFERTAGELDAVELEQAVGGSFGVTNVGTGGSNLGSGGGMTPDPQPIAPGHVAQ